MTKHPWIKWYPTDWRADPALRLCSLGARGLWIELLGFMHESEPYGHLLVNGKAPTVAQIASLVGVEWSAFEPVFAELKASGVPSFTDAGVMFSRRMLRDKEKALRDASNGKGGGNPKLKGTDKPAVNGGVNPQGVAGDKPAVNGGVNPQGVAGDKPAVNGGDKAQKLEVRSQKLEKPKSKPRSKTLSQAAPAPDGVRDEVWQSWLRHRGKKLTAEAITLQTRKLAAFAALGDDPNAVIEQSIANTWAGLFRVGYDEKGPRLVTVHDKRSDTADQMFRRGKYAKPNDGSGSIPAEYTRVADDVG